MKRNSRYATGVCFLGGLFVLFQFLLQGSVSLMVPQLKSDLCLDQVGIGFLSSSFLYPYIILQIPSGIIVDKIGIKRTLIASTFLLSLSTLSFSLANNEIIADLSRVMMGIASAPGVVCAMCLAANWFSQKYFALIAGLIEMLGMFGGALGDILLSESISHYGWRYSVFLCALFSVILLLLIIFFVKDKPKDTPTETYKDDDNNTLYFGSIFKSKNLWFSALYGGCIFAIITTFASLWAIPFYQHLYHTHQTAAHITALIFFGAGLGAVLSGFLSARIGKIKPIMAIFSLLSVILFSLILISPLNVVLGGIMSLLLGISVGAYVLPFALIKRIVPQNSRGIAMGFTNMSVIIIGALCLPLVGLILKKLTSLNINGCVIADTSIYQIALSPLVLGLLIALTVSLFIQENA
ncbi:MFS transporter [Thiotrichales bacterium 19S11-10]|nr:MFS transporter [Thiotrichales bacterium 19S11-10]